MIILEIGLNHLGDESKLLSMVQKLCLTEANAITLQIREPQFYAQQKWQRYRLEDKVYEKIAKEIKKHNKLFGLACSDIEKINIHDSYGDFYKVLSKDIHEVSLNKKLRQTNKIVYISTGNAGFEEIDRALDINPDAKLIHTRLNNDIQEVNLSAITRMKEKYGDRILFGNHCEYKEVIFAATSFKPAGYFIYVKDSDCHVNIPPDFKHAVCINNVNYYCNTVSLLKQSIGDGKKSTSTNQIEGQI